MHATNHAGFRDGLGEVEAIDHLPPLGERIREVVAEVEAQHAGVGREAGTAPAFDVAREVAWRKVRRTGAADGDRLPGRAQLGLHEHGERFLRGHAPAEWDRVAEEEDSVATSGPPPSETRHGRPRR